MKQPSDVLVPVQLVALGAAALWPGRARWSLPGPVSVGADLVAAGGVGLVAAGALSLGRDLTPFVTPRDGASLRTGGSYAISRNPIYAGLLLLAGGVAVRRRRPEPLAAFAVLATALHVKTGAEEERLRERFGADYEAYAARVPRMIGLPGRFRALS